MQYPTTRKDDIKEESFGTLVQDPYRWLEDDHSDETIAWLKAQQELTESYLNSFPGRKAMLERVRALNDYPKQTCPTKHGDWYYHYKNDGLQNQWVMWRRKAGEETEELFFDPNTISEDGTTRAYPIGWSKDYRYVCFNYSQAGADLGEFRIMDLATKEFLPDVLKDMRHTNVAWYKDGFFYGRYDKSQDYQAQDCDQKIYFHRLGDPVSEDKLVFEDPEHPLRFLHTYVSDDEKTLFLYQSQGTHGNQVHFRPAGDDKAPWTLLFEGFEYDGWPTDGFEEGIFYLFTNKGAKNFRLLKVDLTKPQEDNWIEIIPERDYPLDSVIPVGGKLIAIYTKDVQSQIEVLDADGKFLYPIQMPYQGGTQFTCGRSTDREGYFYFESFIKPSESYHYDVDTNTLSFYYRDPVPADLDALVSKQIFFSSKDGTRVPMTLIYKEGLQLDGSHPLLLYGYGGFNISLQPGFSASRIALIEQGFIYVVVNLRGGGEYGENWHEQGMLLNKQNVFDDFCAAAEYLIREGYTSADRLAINGGSNGGLLVGACLTQRPELFRAAVPSMGVLDMLRFHKFTCGWGWMVEYGDPGQEEQFRNLLSYSPLHNIKPGVKYPATLVTTADHDDRVIPGHSFKFAATLQEHADPARPVLLYTQFSSSHGPSNLNKTLELWADIWSFLMLELKR